MVARNKLLLAIVGVITLAAVATGWSALDAQETRVAQEQIECGEGAFVRELNWRGYKGEWKPASELTTRDFPLIEVSGFHPDCVPTADHIHEAEEFLKRSYLSAVENG